MYLAGRGEGSLGVSNVQHTVGKEAVMCSFGSANISVILILGELGTAKRAHFNVFSVYIFFK